MSPRRHGARTLAVAALCATGLVLALAAGCARPGTGARDPLGASAPDEVVLRTLRLAGVEQAGVRQDGRTAVARLEVPDISSAADVEIAWQTAAGALVAAYPRAAEYRVLLQTPGSRPLLDLTLAGGATRQAIASDDARALRSSATVTYLPDDDVVALASESASLDDGSAPYLDAKNRAAGLLGPSGSLGEDAAAAELAAKRARAGVPGRPAPGEGADPAATLAARLQMLVSPQAEADVTGATELLLASRALASEASPDDVLLLRAYLALAEAMTAEKPFADSASPAAKVAAAVAKTPVPRSGPQADAVLAAARSPKAPPTATIVTRFARVPSLDTSASAASRPSLPGEVFARLAAAGQVGERALGWQNAEGPQRVAPELWLGYRRADGSVFWLAGEGGPVALTSGLAPGWAWSDPQAALVDAADVGRVLAHFETR